MQGFAWGKSHASEDNKVHHLGHVSFGDVSIRITCISLYNFLTCLLEDLLSIVLFMACAFKCLVAQCIKLILGNITFLSLVKFIPQRIDSFFEHSELKLFLLFLQLNGLVIEGRSGFHWTVIAFGNVTFECFAFVFGEINWSCILIFTLVVTWYLTFNF